MAPRDFYDLNFLAALLRDLDNLAALAQDRHRLEAQGALALPKPRSRSRGSGGTVAYTQRGDLPAPLQTRKYRSALEGARVCSNCNTKRRGLRFQEGPEFF